MLPPSPYVATPASTALPPHLSSKAARVLGTDEKGGAGTISTPTRRQPPGVGPSSTPFVGPMQPTAVSPAMLWICGVSQDLSSFLSHMINAHIIEMMPNVNRHVRSIIHHHPFDVMYVRLRVPLMLNMSHLHLRQQQRLTKNKILWHEDFNWFALCEYCIH
jgi:hypothetical protein